MKCVQALVTALRPIEAQRVSSAATGSTAKMRGARAAVQTTASAGSLITHVTVMMLETLTPIAYVMEEKISYGCGLCSGRLRCYCVAVAAVS